MDKRCVLDLVRLESWRGATIGSLSVDGSVLCNTLELPWEENERNISCIPAGQYRCIMQKCGSGITNGKRGTWCLEGVPGRDGVLIHIGNTVKDSQGCILVGTAVGELDGKRAVLSSRVAFEALHAATEGADECVIRIADR